MNILNSIGGGLLSGVRGVGQGLAAAGGGINKYINAMGMDSALSAGIPQDQLTPQAMRGAGRNWLASIGQGMQTGDYVGARQDMQKEMLAKVQMLQQMKQQEAAKQRMAQFQQAAQQVDPRDPASVAALSRAFPEFSDNIGKIVDPQHTLAQTAQANAIANKANVDAWLSQLPKPVGVKEYKEGISSDGKSMVVYALMDDGSVEEKNVRVPSFIGEGGGYSFNKLTGETKGPEPKPATTELLTNARELQKYDPNRFPTITSAIDYLKPKSTPGSAAAGGGKPPQNMPSPVAKELETGTDLIKQMGSLASGWDPNYVGNPANGVENTVQKYANVGTPGQAEWWSAYDNFINQVRHGLFGSALTKQEKDAFESTIVSGAMRPDLAQNVLKRQVSLVAGAWQRKFNGNMKAYNPEQVKQWDASNIIEGLNANNWITPNPYEGYTPGAPQAQPGKPFSLNPQAAPASSGGWSVRVKK